MSISVSFKTSITNAERNAVFVKAMGIWSAPLSKGVIFCGDA